MLHAVGGC